MMSVSLVTSRAPSTWQVATIHCSRTTLTMRLVT